MNIKVVTMMEKLRSFIKREDGASAIEYALIAGLIAVVIIGGANAIGLELKDIFETIKDSLTGARTGSTTP